ncbi:hypothetical protein HXX76_009536 [Chlamydomonas incerta]|uniref:PIH1 domain-containing protein 1 n=1 Tax=Chlamydomonas incerta TaxID=51695 RepID=A0A835SU36_CHLIN|nr:hypothetical protein HXX76_009536 [Chlamydomonas incerta]|eukprot:KAG2431522.1 hypothetical protein HXX76_009536 [Chlamydomonas incerta]
MPGKAENETLEKSLKELNLTTDEMTKFEKAFKDPEFIKLFEEYAKEVSDPKVKAETDAYLRQIEQQGRAEDVYGAGTQLIVPDPAGAVVKTKVSTSAAAKRLQQEQQQQEAAGAGAGAAPGKQGALPAGQKVFINICTCDKLERYSLTDAKDPATGRLRPKLSIPLSLGPVRQGTDKQGAPAAVYDFVVHPDSWTFAAGNAAGLATLVDTALDHVEQVGRCKLVRAWKRLNCRYKGTDGATEPPVQCIRTSAAAAAGAAGEGAGGRVRPRPDVPGVPDLPGAQTAPPAAAGAAATAAAVAAAAGSGGGASSRSMFSFDKSKKAGGGPAAAAAAPKQEVTDPARPGYAHPDGAVTPEWGLVHSGEADLGETWGDAGKGLAAGGRVPKELVVRVTLPDITSAAAVDLDVGLRCLALTVPGRYRLSVPLPYGVDDAKGRAKFDKARKVLEVTLPVVPPPAPPPGAAAATARAGPALVQELGGMEADAEEAESGGSANGVAEVADVVARDQEAALVRAEVGVKPAPAAAASTAAAASAPAASEDAVSAAGSAAAASDAASSQSGVAGGRAHESQQEEQQQQEEADGLTENERRWRQLHAKQHAEEEAAAAAAAATAQVDAAADAASTSRGAQPAEPGAAAQGEAAAAAAAPPPPAPAPAPTALLRPRLNRELAMELD